MTKKTFCSRKATKTPERGEGRGTREADLSNRARKKKNCEDEI